MVEIITKDSNRATIEEIITKRFKQGHYGGTPGLQGLWAHGLQGYIATGL